MATIHVPQALQPDEQDVTGRVLLIGALSGVLYLAVYFAQRAIFLNGRTSVAAGVPAATPGSRSYLFWEVAGYGAATLALFVLYAWLLLLCRNGRLRHWRAQALVLLVPLLFNLGLLFGRPYLSTDDFSYMVHGYLGATPGHNPYTDAVRDAGSTAVAAKITAWGWLPETHTVSPYGPLWTQIEIGAARLSGQVSGQLLLLKSTVVLCSLLSALLIWLILKRVRPQDQLLGTLLYLWNPMIIVEFAGEGHNDAVMIVFTLLAILLAVQARPTGTLIALMLGILTKYLPLFLLPAQVVYLYRTRRSWRQIVFQLAVGLVAGLLLAVVLYWPVWAGAATFQGVRGQGQARVIASTPFTLFWYLQRSRPEAEAARLASTIMTAIFGIYVLVVSVRVRDAASLLQACGRIALFYLLVASPSYWPWYTTLPLALMALSPRGTFFWMSLVLTLCSRLTAPISDITVNGFTVWNVEVWSTTVIGLLLPLLVFVLLSARQWRRPAAPTAPLGV